MLKLGSDFLISTAWLGVRDLVAQLQGLIQGPYPVITVTGEGGLGKTTLALKAAYEVLDASDSPFEAIVWTTSKTTQLTPLEIVRIEGAIRDSLGMFEAVASELGGKADLGDALDEVLAYLREFKILLVLDNLETVIDVRVRAFLAQLPAGSKVVITSRVALGAFEFPLQLPPLTKSDGIDLLRALAKSRGVHQLVRIPNNQLAGFVDRLQSSPGYIKWFVAAVQAGVRPEEALDRPDVFLDFCLSNVYENVSQQAKHVLSSLVVLPARRSLAELAFLTEMDVFDLRRAVHELLLSNMLAMSSSPTGTSFETTYDLTELARAYLARHHPPSQPEQNALRTRNGQLRVEGERAGASQERNPYSDLLNVSIRSQTDVPVARLLKDALYAARRGDLGEAERLVNQARILSPGYAEVHRVTAMMETRRQNLAAAREAFEAALELDPDSASLRFWYAGFLMRWLSDIDGAVAQLEQTSRLDPAAPEIVLELARAQLIRKKYGKAKSLLQPILDLRDLSLWNRRKAHDLHLQAFLRRALFFLRESSDPEGALTELQQLQEAYLDMPHSAVDAVIRETLRKAAECADRCVYSARDSQLKRDGGELAAFLREAASSGGKEESRLPEGMASGVIRDIFHEKGFGFIKTSDGREFFFHRTDMNLHESWWTVQKGEEVVFKPERGPKGPFASSVWRTADYSPSAGRR